MSFPPTVDLEALAVEVVAALGNEHPNEAGGGYLKSHLREALIPMAGKIAVHLRDYLYDSAMGGSPERQAQFDQLSKFRDLMEEASSLFMTSETANEGVPIDWWIPVSHQLHRTGQPIDFAQIFGTLATHTELALADKFPKNDKRPDGRPHKSDDRQRDLLTLVICLANLFEGATGERATTYADGEFVTFLSVVFPVANIHLTLSTIEKKAQAARQRKEAAKFVP